VLVKKQNHIRSISLPVQQHSTFDLLMKISNIPKPVWAIGFALEQTLHVVAFAVFSFLILKRLQHKQPLYNFFATLLQNNMT
jgi:hypothetical protein